MSTIFSRLAQVAMHLCIATLVIHNYECDSKVGKDMDFAQWHSFSLLRFIVLFAIVFFTLNWGYQKTSGTVIEKAFIDIATVRPSAFIINQLQSAERVHAQGHRLVSSQVKLSVLKGCEGTESLFLIVAAILAFRSPWRHTLAGVALGTVVIYLANQARIVALYFALRHDRELFAALHGYIAPMLIIAVGCLFYLWWIQWPHRKSPKQSSFTPV